MLLKPSFKVGSSVAALTIIIYFIHVTLCVNSPLLLNNVNMVHTLIAWGYLNRGFILRKAPFELQIEHSSFCFLFMARYIFCSISRWNEAHPLPKGIYLHHHRKNVFVFWCSCFILSCLKRKKYNNVVHRGWKLLTWNTYNYEMDDKTFNTM